jgi:hypothetical protein
MRRGVPAKVEPEMANMPDVEVKAEQQAEVAAQVELQGGSNAYRTQWLDVPVGEGWALQLVTESGRAGETRAHGARPGGPTSDETLRGDRGGSLEDDALDDGSFEQGGGLTVVWGEPALQGPSGELSLLDVPWSIATPAGVLRHDVLQRDVLRPGVGEGDGGLLLGGRPLDRAISMKTGARVCFRVPAGYNRFVAECGFDGAALPWKEGVSTRCIILRETLGAPPVDEMPRASPGAPPQGQEG